MRPMYIFILHRNKVLFIGAMVNAGECREIETYYCIYMLVKMGIFLLVMGGKIWVLLWCPMMKYEILSLNNYILKILNIHKKFQVKISLAS